MAFPGEETLIDGKSTSGTDHAKRPTEAMT